MAEVVDGVDALRRAAREAGRVEARSVVFRPYPAPP
jgi:hypothetical protein